MSSMWSQMNVPFIEESSDEEDSNSKGNLDMEELHLVGYVQVQVVGLQYYNGTVNDNEMVQLIREPENRFDSNAIRVDNIRGERVGHIERYKAFYLATFVDGHTIVIEGIVTSGNLRNRYKMPCNVYIFSQPSNVNFLREHFARCGLDLVSPTQDGVALPEQATGVSEKVTSREKQKRKIDDMFESLIQAPAERQTMEPSSIITCQMMQHQKEALAWMIRRENSSGLPPFWEAEAVKGSKQENYKNTITNFSTKERPKPLRGGILADDMGLGKTLEMLALIATNRPGEVLPPVVDIVQQTNQKPDEATQPSKRRKLQDEDKKIKKGKSKSANKALSNSDAYAHPPEVGGPRATLVVCPLTVMSNWVEQLSDHTKQGSLAVHLYHGADRAKDVKTLASKDIVFTTYGVLAKENSCSHPILHKVHWLRVILDEAHLVKSSNAQQTKAAVHLKAERRWAVTGTPLQNSVKDLFSLMTFLQLQPLDVKSIWTRTIERPLRNGETRGFSRLQGLLSAISLRRTKETEIDGRRLVDLPSKTVTVYPVQLSAEHRLVYDEMELKGRSLVGSYLQAGTVLQNYANVLSIILRLRQICDHASLCPEHADLLAASSSGNQGTSLASPELLQKLLAQTMEEFDCPICLSPPSCAVITRCAHVFCQRCIQKTLKCDKQACPLCRFPLTDSDIFSAPEEEADDSSVENGVKTSAKIEALINLLRSTREKDPSIKSVVFSQFAKMLTLVQQPLRDAGFEYTRIDGSMSSSKRDEALMAFRSTEPTSPTVFLLSLKAAGAGLNLVSASHVYMLDPWWNPAVDEQAMDRVHRLGQTRDVHVHRLIVADSIEERILELQERKRQLAQIAFEKSMPKDQKLRRIEDVQLLMRL